MRRKGLLRSFCGMLAFSLLVCSVPCYSESVYEITETELTALEQNHKALMERLGNAEKELEKSEKELEKHEASLRGLEKRLQIQAESYRELERKRNLLIKWGVPVAVVVAAGCFAGGLYLGTQLK